MQAEHAGFVVVMTVASQFVTLGENDEVVGAVLLLGNVEARVNFAE